MPRMTYDVVANLVAANNQSGQADAVIIALIYKESRFDPLAKAATSTATGLMQMTKGAVTEVNRVKKTAYKHDTMKLPAANVMVGTSYLRIRIRVAGGSLVNGLNGYGTGPGYATSIMRAADRLPDAADPMSVLIEEIGKP